MKNTLLFIIITGLFFSGCMYASENYVAENDSYKYKGSYVGFKWDAVEERAEGHCSDGHNVISQSNEGRLIGTQTNIKIVPKHVDVECK